MSASQATILWHLAITVLPSSCYGCILLMSRTRGRHAENSPLWFAEDITCQLRCPSAASIPEGCAAPEIPSCIFNENLERYLIVTLLTCFQSMCFAITLTYLTSKHSEESGDFQTDADATDSYTKINRNKCFNSNKWGYQTGGIGLIDRQMVKQMQTRFSPPAKIL